jgi:hypothetical protein
MKTILLLVTAFCSFALTGISQQPKSEPWRAKRCGILYPLVATGRGELTVDNGTTDHAIAKLIDTLTDKKVCSIYIQPFTKFTLREVPDGHYKLIFCFGGDTLQGRDGFAAPTSSSEFENRLHFRTITKRTPTENGVEIRTSTSVLTITLHEVISGNAETDGIPLAEFDKY